MPSKPFTHLIVPESLSSLRIDACALNLFSILSSRSQAKKWVKSGNILLNNETVKSDRRVKEGDVLSLSPPLKHISPLDIPLPIIFQDSHLVVVNKPPGLFVSGRHPKTLTRVLCHHIQPSVQPDALQYAQPAHRLDRRTSGLIVCGKTASALSKLGHLFERRQIHKSYRAIACGYLKEGESNQPVNGKTAHTEWKPIRHVRSVHTEWLTELQVNITTGRMHQIRIHLSEQGHPILGDDLYTSGSVLKSKGLFLCAVSLRFNHPITQLEVNCHIEPPQKFNSQLFRESQRWDRHNGS